MKQENANTKKESDSSKTEVLDLSDSCFTNSLCSARECTGLIPSPPQTEAELDSYEEMYPFLVPPITAKNQQKS